MINILFIEVQLLLVPNVGDIRHGVNRSDNEVMAIYVISTGGTKKRNANDMNPTSGT